MQHGTTFGSRRRSEALQPILQRALNQHGMHRRLPRRVTPELWARALGAQIAARAQPSALTAGTLHVLVQDHRWRDQLDAARLFLIERLNRHLGGNVVRALQFGLAHAGALEPSRGILEPKAARRAPPPHLVGNTDALSPDLREALLSAASAWAARA